MRIFIGPNEIANINAILASALKEKEIKVTAVRYNMSPFFEGMRYDVALNFQGLNKLQKIFKYLYHFPKFFLKHDAFIFLFGASLLPCNLDIPILKLFHKKTVMWFLGSDIRHYEAVEATIRKMGIKYQLSEAYREEPKALKRKLRMIRRVEKYVDYIISEPSYSQLLTRDDLGKEMASKIYIPLDVDNIRYNNAPNPRPVVVHAPSNDEIKGTTYILKAVEQLKKEGYDFDFRLFRNMSNIEVRRTLSEADIAVDQLFAAGPGMFALESMAAGCAVLGGNIPEFAGYPRELPIIHTDPDNIYQNLKMLLENPELRRELGEKGRKYVEKYHDHRKIADDFIRLLAGSK
ncbi:MAG: glycosyltransferase family 4 protein [Dehalococcoidales bacterium]